MDLIFKRYQNPFSFLDIYISNNSFGECVEFIHKQSQEEKWWEMYLATLPLNDKSFIDWKAENSKSETTTNSNITKDDLDTIIENSQNILSGFKPPQ
jgi:hypothetical protein